jgi:hypothetical protein
MGAQPLFGGTTVQRADVIQNMGFRFPVMDWQLIGPYGLAVDRAVWTGG